MADNLTTQSGTPATVPSASVIATDDVAGVHFQRVKLVDGTLDSNVGIAGDATNGLDVDVTRVQGTVTVGDGGSTLSVDDGGGSLTVDGTVGVSGSVAVTGPLTDTQLRAVAVPVSGTFYPATQAVSGPLTNTELRATDVPVSGPLTDTQIRATALPVSGTVLVTGVATETTLTSINTKTPALGQALEAASIPVVLTAAQVLTLTPPAAISGFATASKQTDGTQKSKVTDGTRDATVKAASTAAVAADTALVVAISPNNTLNVANAPIASIVGGVSTATNGTSPFQVVALVASKQLAITSISVVNTGTAATLVTLQNGSGGTALYATMAPPGGGSNMTLPTPILTTAGVGLFAVCAVASSSVTVCAAGYSV